MLRYGLSLIAALLACACARPESVDLDSYRATVRIRRVEADALLGVLRSPPPAHGDRVRRLRELFHGVGCEDVEERSVSGSPIPNVVCTLRGATDSVIVVGANLDRPKAPLERLENWSGASMLPALYWALSTEDRHHTFEFVAFSNFSHRWTSGHSVTARPVLTMGSERYARGLQEDVRAMVNLQALGLGDTAAWQSRADGDLWLDLASVASSMDLPLRGSNPSPGFATDADAFRVAAVPSITIHSYGATGVSFWARSGEDLGSIDPESYVVSFRLVAAYLGYLDQSLAARRGMAVP